MMRAMATTQLTSIEFVIGNPSGLAIWTAFGDNPWVSVAGDDVCKEGAADPIAVAVWMRPEEDGKHIPESQANIKSKYTRVIPNPTQLLSSVISSPEGNS